MIRLHKATHGKTKGRIGNLHRLITTLMTRELMREDIAELLQIGPSGVRKYVKDLGATVEVVRYVDGTATFVGYPVYRLAVSIEQARAYLANLAAAPAARQVGASKSALNIASQDPARHFHILADDTHYAVRLNRGPVARDPLVAALFGPRAVEMRV